MKKHTQILFLNWLKVIYSTNYRKRNRTTTEEKGKSARITVNNNYRKAKRHFISQWHNNGNTEGIGLFLSEIFEQYFKVSKIY